jgi:hypothetical protein
MGWCELTLNGFKRPGSTKVYNAELFNRGLPGEASSWRNGRALCGLSLIERKDSPALYPTEVNLRCFRQSYRIATR